jgi:hypothetical protein
MTIYKEKLETVRKQVLVINSSRIISATDRDALVVSIKKQMAEGLVVLPAGFEGFTVDADYLVVKEAEA